jgi:hypothetical protein
VSPSTLVLRLLISLPSPRTKTDRFSPAITATRAEPLNSTRVKAGVLRLEVFSTPEPFDSAELMFTSTLQAETSKTTAGIARARSLELPFMPGVFQ